MNAKTNKKHQKSREGELDSDGLCPLVTGRHNECYCRNMNSINVLPAIRFCLGNYKECEVYKRKKS